MKKLLEILILSFLILHMNSVANSFSIESYLQEGMTKKEVKKRINNRGSSELEKTFEIQKSIGEHGHRGNVFYGSVYRKFFPEYKTEILTHWYNRSLAFGGKNTGDGRNPPEENFPYYVFENVTKPVTCKGSLYCRGSIGNGTLKSVVFSKNEALSIASPEYAKKIEDENKRKEEKRKIAEEKRIKEAEERKIAEEKRKKEEEERKRIAEKERKEKEAAEAKKPKPKVSSQIDSSLITIGSGSGFYINNQGYALTNNHVIEICKQTVAVIDGEETLFKVIATDITNDVAVLKTNLRSRNFIKINDEGAKLGENVVAVGYPLAGKLSDSVKVTRGIVSSLSGINNNIGQIQIDAALQPGNSGGPVLNENGELIGIASAGLNKLLMAKEAGYVPENVNFAVASPIVSNILKSKKIKFTKQGFFSSSYSNTELAELGNNSTMQLFCRNTKVAYNKLKSSNKYSTVLLDQLETD